MSGDDKREAERLAAILQTLVERRKALLLRVSEKGVEIAQARAAIAELEHDLRCIEAEDNEARADLVQVNWRLEAARAKQ